MTILSVNEFFTNHAEGLALLWVAGGEGNNRSLLLDPQQKLGNVGYLNLIHPHQIQIIGPYELTYLAALSTEEYQKTLAQLFENSKLACLIVVDSDEVSTTVTQYADRYQVPLFTSRFTGESLISHLHATLARLLGQRTTLHGVFMDVLGMGVLIMGDSGTGKSELALELVSRGHRLVADDAPEFCKVGPDTIVGICPLEMTPFLEVRGLGVLNVQALFGDRAAKKEETLCLIIHIEQMTPNRVQTIDRLQGDYRVRRVLDVDIPEICLPVAPGRNLAVLLECAVRNHSLKMQGYNAADDFCEHQQRAMRVNEK
ncbi:MAG: HPr(Ser) kinase/phosphatase [Thiotrichaceae bacterium IS1]|nr:MAG: HPr(Ser) kinase/phosphatase [Thiotrichaceae bacterium IS1]